MQFTCGIKSLFAYLNLPKATAFPSEEQWSKDQYKGKLGAIWSCKHNSSLPHSFKTGGSTLHAIWWVNKRGKGSCFGGTYRRKLSSHSHCTLQNVLSSQDKAFLNLKEVFNANGTIHPSVFKYSVTMQRVKYSSLELSRCALLSEQCG